MRVLLLFLSVAVLSASACEYPPEKWCDSQYIAEQCKMFDICSGLGLLPGAAAPRVSIALYYESLCPGCRAFIQGQLAEAVQKVQDLITVDLVPYGNAMEEKIDNEWKFSCQHGKPECEGNVIETCAISVLQQFEAYWPFVLCLESTEGDFKITAPLCANQTSVDLEPIAACAAGSRGNHLEHEMAQKTNALQPPHKYTPWIVINGEHTEFIQDMAQSHLVRYICRVYKGEKPSACSEFVDEDPKRCDRV